jgi:phenazine biosynthesis protein phzE
MPTQIAEPPGEQHIANLGMLLGATSSPFAVLHRPESTGPEQVEVLVGDVLTVSRLADLPLPELSRRGEPRWDLLALVPYRQVAERGLACRDDGTPLTVMRVRDQRVETVTNLMRQVPDTPIDLRDGDFDIDDASYADLVRRILTDEIGRGEGSNFVIKRSFVATVANYSPRTALALFRRLLRAESGAYWTFVVHTGERTLIGATPERHVSLADGVATMNPISGTYRYPPAGPTMPDLLRFLADRKEADELYMVVDEELKMMGRICDGGGRVVGPHLKEMARLAHTEYFIEGPSSLDVRAILRETMLAPTITGSPLESACRVIARYEQHGRGYYGGVIALVGQAAGNRTLDAAIIIRTADIDPSGRLEIGVGATLVRHSDASAEVAETRTKAAGLLAAAQPAQPPADRSGAAAGTPAGWAADPRIRQALTARNVRLSRFWLAQDSVRPDAIAALAGLRALVIDAEDTFTSMLGHQLRALGPAVTIRRFDADYDPRDYHLVVVGPGPGDPRETDHPKISTLRRLTSQLLADGTPFLSVCLGHQVLASLLGLELVRRATPNQGVQRQIEYFGRTAWVGFYNSFVARCQADELACPDLPGLVEVARDAGSGEVYGLRGPGFRSMQFHVESLLTEHGPAILTEAITALLRVDSPTI